MTVELSKQDLDLILSCIGVALSIVQNDLDARQLLEALQDKLMKSGETMLESRA